MVLVLDTSLVKRYWKSAIVSVNYNFLSHVIYFICIIHNLWCSHAHSKSKQNIFQFIQVKPPRTFDTHAQKNEDTKIRHHRLPSVVYKKLNGNFKTPPYFETSGNHWTVRLGHSKACVITKSCKNGVFFFQILYSSLMILSSTASSKGSTTKKKQQH